MKTAIATLVFAALHSALASRRAKHVAANLIGKERSEAAYRVFYIGQGLVSFAALLAYCARLPRHTVYRIDGKGALPLRAGQVAGVIQLLAGAYQIGLKRWGGIDKLQAWRRGEEMPTGPVAQGPEMGKDGTLTTGGPFRWSRHPLNFAAVPIFWLTPHMTTRRLAFNAVGTAYMMLGSLHEEARLRAAYGDAYERYLQTRVPFFWPGVPPRLTERHQRPHQHGSLENGSRP